MSRILNTHVSLWDPSGDLAVLAPGTELPEWAEGRIGDHCLEPEATEAAEFTAGGIEGDEGADGDPAVGDADPDDEGDGDAEDSDDVDPAAKTDAPDFTAPAPRRGRPRMA